MWLKTEINEEMQTTETASTSTEYSELYNYTWEKLLSTKAYVGQNGINKVRQGDMKTPAGIYNITMAFGRKNLQALQEYHILRSTNTIIGLTKRKLIINLLM